jgi:hypothetical protein
MFGQSLHVGLGTRVSVIKKQNQVAINKFIYLMPPYKPPNTVCVRRHDQQWDVFVLACRTLVPIF